MEEPEGVDARVHKWDQRFLGLAKHISQWSRDPSTQVGAVVARGDKTICSVGFNGFPRGIADDERLHDREIKYDLVVHGELNAILHAREPVRGYTVYTYPLPPCVRCSVALIQAGISRVVAPPPIERWRESCERAMAAFREAGVEFVIMELEA